MGVFCVITANSGIISSVFLHKNFCYGYSVNLPHWNDSNWYPQYIFRENYPKILSSYAALSHSSNTILGT